MRIALFGGSFNPPHVAHQMVALYVLETAEVDELWLVPTFKHAFDKHLAPFEHRLAMCERAAAALGPRARVSDVERVLGGESRTLQTVRHLQGTHPGHSFAWIIGSDLVAETETWYGAEELRRTVPFIVVDRGSDRPHNPAQTEPAPRVTMPAVSSTLVREALAQGERVDDLVPRAVLDYIFEHGLFQTRDAP